MTHTVLPDGSAFAILSTPLPSNHWLTADGYNVPPMPLRLGGDDPRRQLFNDAVRAAARYAIRASTMNGKENDFDPDAMVQNMVVGLLGYHTPDGLCGEEWADPKELPDLLGRSATSGANSAAPHVVKIHKFGRRGTGKHEYEMSDGSIATMNELDALLSAAKHANSLKAKDTEIAELRAELAELKGRYAENAKPDSGPADE